MAAKVGSLPKPPPDLGSRSLPVKGIKGPLFRVHLASYSPLHFGKTGTSRFDDPLRKYGVLYAATTPQAAFAEAFLRELDFMVIEEKAVRERGLSEIGIKTLRCVDLTGHGLRRLSCDNRIADELPCDTPGLWSKALHEHPQRPDGILYRSRHNPRFVCVAVFSRARKHLLVKKTSLLLSQQCMPWTVKQFTVYNLAILPS